MESLYYFEFCVVILSCGLKIKKNFFSVITPFLDYYVILKNLFCSITKLAIINRLACEVVIFHSS